MLIKARKADEEIIVIDGGSKDGTPAYLESLYEKNQIQQYLSEPDKGEAHGCNKAILKAKGELIKIISDDDIYSFEAIDGCKKFMLENREYDLMASNIIQVNLSSNEKVKAVFIKNNERDFEDWKNGKRANTFFCGLSLMMRRSSLPLLGLFNTYFKMIDIEYCVRVTSIKAKIAYSTNPVVISIINDNSNSTLFTAAYEKEYIKVSFAYEYFNNYLINYNYHNPYSIKDSVTNFFKLLKNRAGKQKIVNSNYTISTNEFDNIEKSNYEEIYLRGLQLMTDFSKKYKAVFIR